MMKSLSRRLGQFVSVISVHIRKGARIAGMAGQVRYTNAPKRLPQAPAAG
jgi:hypothetical protein